MQARDTYRRSVMVILVALGSALAYASASVLQQYTAAQAPPEEALRVSLLWSLAHRPLWLLGIVADIVGFALQFIALGHGSLVLVQPLLVCGLLFALPLGAAINSRRWLTGREWLGSGIVVAGLALFLVVASPAPGNSTTSGIAWTIVSAATLGPSMVLVAMAGRSSPAARATLLATSAGFIYGLTAAYTKFVAYVVTQDSGGALHVVARVFESWQTYGLVGAGVVSMVLSQTAFQGGPLGWSLPALSGVDPIVSIVIGALAFSEPIQAAPEDIVLEAIGLVLVIGGIVMLNHYGLVHQAPPTRLVESQEPA